MKKKRNIEIKRKGKDPVMEKLETVEIGKEKKEGPQIKILVIFGDYLKPK